MGARKESRRIRQVPPRSREIIYGFHPAVAALRNSKRVVHQVHVTRNMAERLGDDLKAVEGRIEILRPADIDRLTGPGAVHQGIVIEAAPLAQPDLESIGADGPVVVLDQVTDPHNVGAIVRSCAAFGVKAVVMTARHSPEASAVLAKSASGALEHVAIVKVTNLARAIEQLKDAGFAVIGLDSEAPATIEQMSLPGPHAVVLGAEGKGLRQLTRKSCDAMVRLDLPGTLTSLNVSNAAALALYALVRR